MEVAFLFGGIVAFFASALVTSQGLMVVVPSGADRGAARQFLPALTAVSRRALSGLWLVVASVGAELLGSAWPLAH
ncbi:MAG: hypothetical protein ACM30I_13010 [Gemmatimonas sp.]